MIYRCIANRRRRYGCPLPRKRILRKLAGIIVLLICTFSIYLSTVYLDSLPQKIKIFVQHYRSSTQTPKYQLPSSNSGNCLNHKDELNFLNNYTNGAGWTHFPLIIPHVEPNISCEEKKLFLVVVVNSASNKKHRLLRDAIRKTWGNSTVENQVKHKWRLFFALGISVDDAVNVKIRQEALKYNDIIVGNFTDIYKNIVFKTFMSHSWVYLRFSCKYILKTDDDVYVRVSRLTRWMEKQGFPDPFYGGLIEQVAVVYRDPRSQWFISREDFNETHWPPFSHGAFQVLSTAILPRYFNYTQFRKPFNTDDAYFGVIARDLGITATDIPGFSLSPPKKDGELMIAIAFGHAMDAPTIMKYYLRYKELIF